MADYELDRLFGLAMTDARFFRQLREEPCHAAAQFELTESEMQAVVRIAPTVGSIDDLAVQLYEWIESQPADQDRVPDAIPVRIPLEQIGLGTRQPYLFSSNPSLNKAGTRDESGLYLKWKAYAARS